MFRVRSLSLRRPSGATGLAALAPAFAAAAMAAAGALATGCTPQIGDHCYLNTDCSLQGTLVCDNAAPNGYCTSFNCSPNTCQGQGPAACVMLYPEVPGCPYNGYRAPTRTNRTLCLKSCNSNSDCRTGEGYECADPRGPPWEALILDDDQNQRVCLAIPTALDSGVAAEAGSSAEPAVCMPEGPVLSPIDGGAPDAPGGD